MSKNLKIGQIVNVYEDGKTFRASKAIVVKIESGRIHLNCTDTWNEREIRRVFIFKQGRKSVFHNFYNNYFFYKNELQKSNKEYLEVEALDSPFFKYLLDFSTILEFDDWFKEKGYEEEKL